jgi:hypothetical protein
VTRQFSYLSANDPRLHFGLGTAPTADVEIHWPSGTSEPYSGLAAGQLVTIRERSRHRRRQTFPAKILSQARFPDPL